MSEPSPPVMVCLTLDSDSPDSCVLGYRMFCKATLYWVRSSQEDIQREREREDPVKVKRKMSSLVKVAAIFVEAMARLYQIF